MDHLLQPIAQKQRSYLKDTTDFINFIEKTQVSNDTILVSMDVTSLYTNIPQEEGITIVCQAYEKYHNNSPPIPSHYLKQMLGLILKENSFQFNGVNYLQCFGTTMGTRMAVAFANLFMAEIETKLLHQSSIKPIVWKRYIDDVFSLWDVRKQDIDLFTEQWDVRKQDIDLFIEQANTFHPTIKFTAEISETEITFLDTVVYKGERFQNEAILDVKTHYKPTETFQYTHYSSCHPPGVKKGFIKGEAIRLLRTNSSKSNFQEAMCNFKIRLEARGHPKSLIEKKISEVSFAARQSTPEKQTKKTKGNILPFVIAYHPGVNNLKQILMQEWNLIQNQPMLKTIYITPPIISYKRGKSLKDILVRAKL